ncbi:MAG TPA: hypothetical protein PLX97_10270, partial [Gemmatales bacterium]|nr:hypothetical protein [Gemmatales bacterium]
MCHDAKRNWALVAKIVVVLAIVAIALQQLAFLLWHHPVSITGVVVLLAVLGYLVLQRLFILLWSEYKQEALQRSIDRSWLHQLGGGNAHGVELWILTILPMVVCIHKV